MRKIIFITIFIFAFCAFTFAQKSNCPEISVNTLPVAVQIGEAATFTVSIAENSAYNPEYVWTISSGKIIEGQGTETITVEMTSDSSVTATVEVKGLPEGCENTASEAAITGCFPPSPMMLDEFEISSRINQARLDGIISELESNSDDTAYFIIYPNEKDSSKKIKSREDHIRNYLLENNIDSGRMIFVRASGGDSDLDNSVIRLWRVPPGASPPTP